MSDLATRTWVGPFVDRPVSDLASPPGPIGTPACAATQEVK